MAGLGDSTRVAVRVIPNARRNEVGGERAGRLLVRTTAKAIDGQANASVRKQIAEHFGVAMRRVEIESGHRSRDKILRIDPRGRQAKRVSPT